MQVLEATVDKFTFRVPTDRRYSADGLWVQETAPGRVRIGLTDYLQQRSGDVAFASPQPVGTVLAVGDELASLETLKVVLALPAPVAGTIVAVNEALEVGPEIINQDPYGGGWLLEVELAMGSRDAGGVLLPEDYFARMRAEAEEEAQLL